MICNSWELLYLMIFATRIKLQHNLINAYRFIFHEMMEIIHRTSYLYKSNRFDWLKRQLQNKFIWHVYREDAFLFKTKIRKLFMTLHIEDIFL